MTTIKTLEDCQKEIGYAYKAGQANGIKRGKEMIAQIIEEIPPELELGASWNHSVTKPVINLKQQLRDKWL